MMKHQRKTLISLSLASALVAFSVGNSELLAQTSVPAAPPTAPYAPKPQIDAATTIGVATNQAVTVNSTGRISDRVGLLPNQIVSVSVKFAAMKVGHSITIEALDGGYIRTAGWPLIVAADNTTSFTFQASGEPGMHRVILHDGAQEIGLQFWILDQSNPAANPSTIN